MKKIILIPIFITLMTGVLSIFFQWLGYLWLIIIILCLLLLLIFGIIRIFYRRLNNGWLRIPLVIIIICFISILSVSLKSLKPALPDKKLSVSAELNYIVNTDQADRFSILNFRLWFNGGKNTMLFRDSIRLNRVLQCFADSIIKSPQDEYNVALVLQHGNKPEHYRIAHKLASDALLHHIPSAEWLSHATWDRWQMSIGKKQKYGTQFTLVSGK